jgi:hypothetical protein
MKNLVDSDKHIFIPLGIISTPVANELKLVKIWITCGFLNLPHTQHILTITFKHIHSHNC